MRPLFIGEVHPNGIQHLGSCSNLSQLRSFIANSSAEWIAISCINAVNGSLMDLKIGDSLSLHSGRVTVGFLPLALTELWAWHESRLGLPLTGVLFAPEQFGVVFARRDVLIDGAGLTHSIFPVWEFWINSIGAKNALFKSLFAVNCESDDALLSYSQLSVPLLVPKRPRSDWNWLLEHIQDLPLKVLANGDANSTELLVLRAGLLQWHDFLDESHQCSQQVEGEGRDRNGDYWHAIMHRREPDYSNSMYWLRRVGTHPVFERLAATAQKILLESGAFEAECRSRVLGLPLQWNSVAFVEFCEEFGSQPDSQLGLAARFIQRAEQSMLICHTYAAPQAKNE